MRDILQQRQLLTMPMAQSAPALFLDRDGVVIEDVHHIRDPDHVRLCSGAQNLLRAARMYGWPVVLITNQSGIARGLFEWHDVERVNQRMQELLGSEAPLAAIYANGHGPGAGASTWRKPSPQMLLEAAADLNLDLRRSLLIGDRLSDLQAGAAAGVAMLFHVLSGHGRSSRESVMEWHRQAADTLASANQLVCRLPALELLNTIDDFPFHLLDQVKSTHR